jgi:rare lipoprotein A
VKRALTGVVVALLLAACAGAPKKPPATAAAPDATNRAPPAAPRGARPDRPGEYTAGGLYRPGVPDSGPAVPPDISALPEPTPQPEPRARYGNRSPYTVLGKSYRVLADADGYVQRGTASWYGEKFHGRATSSLEPYDMYAFSAAHKTLPLPSYARVTNLDNGRSVVVRINDRGPFHAERIIDLSYAAAHRLGYVQAGSARVEVEAVVPGAGDRSPGKAASGVFVQVGAFSSRDNAEDLRTRVATQLAGEPLEVVSTGNLWRLHVGPYGTQDAAREIAERLESLLSLKGFLVVR